MLSVMFYPPRHFARTSGLFAALSDFVWITSASLLVAQWVPNKIVFSGCAVAPTNAARKNSGRGGFLLGFWRIGISTKPCSFMDRLCIGIIFHDNTLLFVQWLTPCIKYAIAVFSSEKNDPPILYSHLQVFPVSMNFSFQLNFNQLSFNRIYISKSN
ncbi:hypothetical protein [Paralcaligenes ginsengisoli]